MDHAPRNTPIYALDIVRFAAALMVVAYHLGFSMWPTWGPATQITGHKVEVPTWAHASWLGFLGVQIFFVISGFVIAYSAERATPFKFMRDRFVRLWPAVFVAATLSAVTFSAFRLESPTWIAKAYIREVFFYPFGSHLDLVVWTLGIEVTFYALVLGLLCLRRFERLDLVAAGLACISTVYNVLVTSLGCMSSLGDPGVCSSKFILSRTTQLLLLDHGCFFALGIFLWLALLKRSARPHLWWAGTALVGCLVQVAWNTRYQAHINPTLATSASMFLGIAVWVVGVLAVVGSVAFNARLSPRVSPRTATAIRLLGQTTYPLYLVHFVGSGVLIVALERAGLGFDASLIASAFMCVVLSMLLARHVEPPMQRALRASIDRVGAKASSARTRLSMLSRRAAD